MQHVSTIYSGNTRIALLVFRISIRIKRRRIRIIIGSIINYHEYSYCQPGSSRGVQIWDALLPSHRRNRGSLAKVDSSCRNPNTTTASEASAGFLRNTTRTHPCGPLQWYERRQSGVILVSGFLTGRPRAEGRRVFRGSQNPTRYRVGIIWNFPSTISTT